MAARFPRLGCAAVAVITTLLVDSAIAEPIRSITIDGNFGDWASVPSHSDPVNDQHDTDHDQQFDTPGYVDHPDVDLLEYKFAHDSNNLYAYFRAGGQIGRTLTAASGTPGRYYAIVTIDVDNNVNTGYWLHEGGYYPTSDGYDMNMEAEFYGGSLNTVHYLSHDALDEFGLMSDFLDLTQDGYVGGYPGPYPAGTVTPASGNYDNYTQWVYHPNDTLTLVADKGPAYTGIATVARSADGRQLEMRAPFKGFLKDSSGNSNLALGRTVNVSFSLEASGELSPGGMWGSDTADPIVGYRLDAPPVPVTGNVLCSFHQKSGLLTITGDAQGNNLTVLCDGSLITVVGLSNTTINGAGFAVYATGKKQSFAIDLGGGADAITLSALEADSVTGSLGAGDDSLSITLSRIKTVKLDGGAGRDQFSSLLSKIKSTKNTGFE